MWILLFGIIVLSGIAKCDNTAYQMELPCVPSNIGTILNKQWIEAVKSINGVNQQNWITNVGIVGGTEDLSGATYITAITALRTGADNAQIFCQPAVGNTIKAYSPDISVYPILNNTEILSKHLDEVDVTILGPGLDKTSYDNGVVKHVIEYCKSKNKPLIVNLNERYINKNVVDMLKNYPTSGVIILTNKNEFKKLYDFIKKPGAGSVTIEIDPNFGNNVYILREGCTDAGISTQQTTSWVLNKPDTKKRSKGQGFLLAGAVATYLQTIKNAKIVDQTGGITYKAAIATYAAAKLIRSCNENAYISNSISVTTTDIVKEIRSTKSVL